MNYNLYSEIKQANEWLNQSLNQCIQKFMQRVMQERIGGAKTDQVTGNIMSKI